MHLITKPLYRRHVQPVHAARRPSVVMRPKVHRNQITIRPKAIDNSWVETSYFVGKYITLFTFFYTGLNYLMYKDARKGLEEEDDEDAQE